jgi:hypothetical protein
VSAIKRFRADVTTVVDGMSIKGVHAKLDVAEEKMLQEFDAWRAQNPINILAITFGRYATRDADDYFYTWLHVLYEMAQTEREQIKATATAKLSPAEREVLGIA